MKHAILIIFALLAAACASQEEHTSQDIKQAVQDFIDVRELQETDSVRVDNQDSWEKIDLNFILYKKRKQAYLFEFRSRCSDLERTPVVADVRKGGNVIHAGFDTIRGCHVAKIYPLTEGELSELQNIGESPGSRN